MFLGNLLKTLLAGGVAGLGSSGSKFGNAVKAGAAVADPVAQKLKQAQVSKAMSEADQAKLQTSITGMKALQTEYLLKRLPQDDQLKHMKVISDFKDNLIKNGASVEAEGDDEKGSDAQAMHLNGTDPRALNHSGHFWSLPTMSEEGKPKFDVVYVPTKDTLQNDFTWNGADGEEHTIPAGTPMLGLPKMVEQLQKDVQGDTKAQHSQMAAALKPNVPDTEIPQTIGWLQNQKKQNTPLYQQNKNAVDAQINMLNPAHDKIQADKLAQARAMSEQKNQLSDEKTAKGAGDDINYVNDYINSKKYTGPGDEALMEKFFDLAKPSTGFRMSQPQIDMLKNARSWMDSAEAKTRHATSGTWFSDTQRSQIADTMKMLAKAKGAGGGAAGSVPPGARPILKGGRTIGYIGADGKRVDFQ
jgi:hypothetical protein